MIFYLKDLTINNFRCYTSKSVTFSKNINILVGDNASGKTSIVEAIYVLIGCKSHRAKSDSEIVKRGASYFFIKGDFSGDETSQIMLSYSKEGKKVARDNKGFHSLSEYIGMYGAVMFCPDDLRLVTKDPATRRKFLDQSICQYDRVYLEALMKYKNLLKQRNEILKTYDLSDKQTVLLNVYSQALITEALIIIKARDTFIKKLNPYFNSAVKTISGGSETGEIVYNPNVTADKISSIFLERTNYDIVTKTTNTGPHRDDFNVYLNGADGGVFASQGQQRTLALAIKLGLANMLREINPKMVIILDDVFGELDKNRQNDLLKLFDVDNQIFITTTSIDHLANEIINKSNIVKITKDGE